MQQLKAWLEWGGGRRQAVCLALSGLALAASIFQLRPLGADPAWAAVVLCGVPIVLEAAIGLATAFDIKADVLVSLALAASVAIGEIFAAGEIAFIMQLGALLEDRTVAKARAGIERLVRLTPRTARRLSDGTETVIPAEQVQVGDVLRVLPGEMVPVDGVILSGHTSVNQAVMTGEPLPVDKAAGDSVCSGAVNQFGAFDMEAVRVGGDSSIQRMIRLVQSADAGKAKIVGTADRWATWIVVTALAAAALTWCFSGELIRAVTILVVFCPCALVLATPTAIMAAIGNATRHGFLVREGDALERLASASYIAFDKTGTLTCGTPSVIAVESTGWSRETLYRLAASAELRSEHPLGKAIVRCYLAEGSEAPAQPERFQMLPGRGVLARVEGMEVLAGNPALLAERHISAGPDARAEAYLAQGCTVVYVAVDQTPAGFLVLSDTLRQDAPEMIGRLLAVPVTPILLTGDHEAAARHMADQLGIRQVRANCLPEDKLSYIQHCQRDGAQVCMVGDGVNDAPALKTAFVGIAMGGTGSDIALDAADIVLTGGQLRELPHLLHLSRRMMTTIRCGLAFSMTLNTIAILLAVAGLLSPVAGALVHNAGSLLVVLNSALLLNWKKRG